MTREEQWPAAEGDGAGVEPRSEVEPAGQARREGEEDRAVEAETERGEQERALDAVGADDPAELDDGDPGSRPRHVGGDEDTSAVTPRAVTWRRVGVAAAGLVAVAATAGAVVFTPDAVPATSAPVDVVQPIAVTPAAEQWVCPGPARLTDTENVGDAQFGSSPVDTVSRIAAYVLPADVHAQLSPIGDGSGQTLKAGGNAAVVTGPAGNGGAVLTVTPPASSATVEAAASVSSLTTAGDLRGLVAATCTPPGVSQWLMGASTEVGSSAQLVLQNPGETAATVRIEVWGADGAVPLGSGATQVVAPGTETVTLLEAAAPEQSRIAVHVSATGGMVGAYIQHNTLDGLVPLGVDDIVAGAEPATRLALSGIVTSGVGVDDPHAPRLRLLAPTTATTARLVVLGPDGQVRLRGAEEVSLPAGVVTDVSLGGLAAGTYGVAIEADAPVVAGAVIDRQGEVDPDLLHPENQYDRAWIAAQAASQPDEQPADPAGEAAVLGGVALVPDARSTIAIGAVPESSLDPQTDTKPTGRFTGTLTAYDAAGNRLGSLDVEVGAGAITTVDAAEIAPGKAAAAMVTLAAAGQSDAIPVWSVLAAAGPTDGTSEQPSLISVLIPAPATSSGATIPVRNDDSLTLPE